MESLGSPSQSPVLPKRSTPAGGVAARSKASSSNNLLGRYLITGQIGQGGMGVVYEAEDMLLKRKVAVKLLPKEISTNSEALKRFLREAQAAAKLSHPNVVAVFDIGEADGSYFIVMELITGGNAQEVLRSRGPFSWTEATRIARDICKGMAAAHKAGLIHRDIKPANILRSEDGVVKLGDFGLVKPTGRKGTVVTALGEVVGTPHYMSPEQAQSTAVDERSDIYSLGATYFALLTGRPPYQAGNSEQVLLAHCYNPIPDPREIVAEVPEACVAIVRKAMAKNRVQRHANVAELLGDLEGVMATLPGTAASVAQPAVSAWSDALPGGNTNAISFAEIHPGENTERMTDPKRRPWLLVGLGFLVLAIMGLLGGAIIVGLAVMNRNGAAPGVQPAPALAKEVDWPALVITADKALRSRDVAAMKTVQQAITVLQNRMVKNEKPAEQEAMRQMLVQLEKARAFRERITEKGLVIGLDGLVTSVVFFPDDRLLVAGQGSAAAGAFVFDSYTGEKRHTLFPRGPKAVVRVQDLSVSHDGKTVAAAFADNTGVRLWHFPDGKETSLPLVAGVNRALSVRFSPTSRDLAVSFEPFGEGRGKPYLKAWNIDTRLEPFLFKAEHSAKVPSIAYCSGGQQVATGSQDKRVILWNAATGRIWRELRTGITITAIACGSDGKTLTAAGTDGAVDLLQFWDYPGDKLLASKPTPHGACRCIAFSRDGRLVACTSGDNVLLWNAETHELLATLTGHSAPVMSLAFSGEGGILATGSNDQTMRLWDVTRFMRPGL